MFKFNKTNKKYLCTVSFEFHNNKLSDFNKSFNYSGYEENASSPYDIKEIEKKYSIKPYSITEYTNTFKPNQFTEILKKIDIFEG